MSLTELLAKVDSAVRPLAAGLPPKAFTKLYSSSRAWFLKRLVAESFSPHEVPAELERTLWDIRFRSPIFNAAGMFKEGHGYGAMSAQGAGAFLSGTTTSAPRAGNHKAGVRLPFAPYPRSGAASNWLGLPNAGHAAAAAVLASVRRVPGCPVGASLMTDPGPQTNDAVDALIEGMRQYDAAGVDFIEINESCPNVDHGPSDLDALVGRLQRIRTRFLDVRSRRLPVIVKFSNDTCDADVPILVDIATDYGFDGINFGNTSTQYKKRRSHIAASEQPVYDWYTGTFGGGVSGRPLAEDSLRLVRLASARLAERAAPGEFHVIRTGGIETAADVRISLESGASLCQWYTGYFEAFALRGHSAYRTLYGELV